MSRPKADRATIVGVLLAAIALIFSIYAYFNPNPAPNSYPVSTPTVTATPSPDATDLAEGPNLGEKSTTGSEFLDEGGALLRGLADDLATYRHSQPWWKLILIWFAWVAIFAWLGNNQGRPGRVTALGCVAYIWYFLPSLSWWGITVAAIAGALAAIVIALEFAPGYSGSDSAAHDIDEPTGDSGQTTA